MPEAALALGSNLGDSAWMIRQALERLGQVEGVEVTRVSSFYRTPPWGVTDQPDFINACALLGTRLSPESLLLAAKSIERDLGRRPGQRWGPRVIDIDLLWVGEEIRDTETLTLPHKHMTERAFVLVPLAEIAPDVLIEGVSVLERARLCDARLEKLA